MKRTALIITAPVALVALLRWAERRGPRAFSRRGADRLLALRGSGRYLWADEHADEYVERMRTGWE